MKIILGSQSPRRKQLLESAFNSSLEILISHQEEIAPSSIDNDKIPEYLALQKAQDIVKQHPIDKESLLITADTLVFLDNNVLGKPKDKTAAKAMLKSLSANSHTVITGVCIYYQTNFYTFNEKTVVYFNALSDQEIEYYVDQFNPMDKAGSYGIQEYIGYIAVQKIEGCYYNIMGLPISKLYQECKRLKIEIY